MVPKTWPVGRILDTAGNYWQACTLHAGVKLDIFTILDRKTATADVVAAKIPANTRGTETLLTALAAMGLLAKTANGYTNTDEAGTWLSRKSAQYVGHIILHHHHLMETWARLDESVCSGAPIKLESRYTPDEKRDSFLLGMFNLAMNLAPRLTPRIDLSGCRRLLDLGGGPGTYAVHFCMNNPGLKATVFDLPTTRPFAMKTIAGFDMTDRIDFVSGDYLKESIPGTYDAAWLSHILHGEGPEDSLKIIQKTVGALAPGGIIAIHEFILNDQKDGPLFPALFSLNMLSGTPRGRSYSQSQLNQLLQTAGVTNIRRIGINAPNDSDIIIGTVASIRDRASD